MNTPNNFTFQLIARSWWKENYKYQEKDWIIERGDNWRVREEKWDKYHSDENRRLYKIYKIKPVKQGNKNYTLVAFPYFSDFEKQSLTNSTSFYHDEALRDLYQKGNLLEEFTYQNLKEKGLKMDQVPFFRLTSTFPFQEKSVGETNHLEAAVYPEKQSEILSKLTDGMEDSDLILLAPFKDYKVEQVGEENEEDEEENQQGQNKKPDKNNHQCQAVHDKLHNWEVNAKVKVLNDCQNDSHTGYYNSKGNFSAPEYAQYTVLTKKCACGGELKGNSYGDEMTKCSAECSAGTKQTITKLLQENNLKNADLPDKFQNWETDLTNSDSKEKIEKILAEMEQLIQELTGQKRNLKSSNKDSNGFLIPVLITIGGVVLLILGLAGSIWWKKRETHSS